MNPLVHVGKMKLTSPETGGLFRLLSKLMTAVSSTIFKVDLDRISTLFGRYFQIRDDYQNLVSADVSIPGSFPPSTTSLATMTYTC